MAAIIASPGMGSERFQTDYNWRMSAQELSHVDGSGKIKMVDISGKEDTDRTAVSRGEIHLNEKTLELIKNHLIKKGDVLTVAQIAGIQAAKKTSEIIPLCHPILIHQIEVDLKIAVEFLGIEIEARIRTNGKTGAEMESLVAVSAAALTVYDMIKAVEKTARIQNIRLVEKHGGKSGDVINE
jgi:cyclic pyranopterin phosphate synthase